MDADLSGENEELQTDSHPGSIIQANAGIYQKETEKARGLCISKSERRCILLLHISMPDEKVV